MPVNYDMPAEDDPRAQFGGFWQLPDGIQAALRPPGVVVVSAVPDQRRKGRLEVDHLDGWSDVADTIAMGDPAFMNGTELDGAVLERAAELLVAIGEHPGLPVTTKRKPVARATVVGTLEKMLAAAGPDTICVHDLITAPTGVKFLAALFGFPWIDNGAAAAGLFTSLTAPSTTEESEHEREANKAAHPGAGAQRAADPGPGQAVTDSARETLRRTNEVRRTATDVLAELTDAQFDRISVLLARELARIVIRDHREIDLRLGASLARR
ncbi:hypothetical protein H8Z55_17455 [Mycobacteroides abscessus]|nr:hypothetical protein [Mycobacteroides abscessus]MCA4749578.1 hypothetical protein [Mycobacteroides abscessus]MCA4767250.1 hypothetical protein [Mycobacteroides abscessus]UBV08837.1 hypothetical protein H8Z55_17455 [Mycobacteroides abscessus]UBV26029.1 hypothetical protein H8Z67_17385 [Mycobacteroides abscessus]